MINQRFFYLSLIHICLSDALECLYEMIDNSKKEHGHAEHTEGQPSVEEKAAVKSNHADTEKKTKKRTTQK